MRKLPVLVIALLASSCARHTDPQRSAPSAAAAPVASAQAREPDAPHYGEVMSEIGHRFELMGRAARARRFRLAHYEIGELEEALHDDLPRAAPPRKGDPHKLAALLGELDKQRLPELKRAVKTRDSAQIDQAFSHTAQICNACHAATGHDFVQVPATPGKSVPLLDPVPAAGSTAPAAPAP